jgi:aspartyl-tRNA(Asn)/glutamyl-tRNA(Gln) amidotransferase subunit A
MKFGDVLDGSLNNAVKLIQTRRVAPYELVDASIARVETDPIARKYFNRFEPEEASKRAAKLTSSANRGETNLAGVPLAHKDLFADRGHIITFGANPAFHRHSCGTADVLRSLRSAGAINLGGLHMSEFAMGGSGWSSFFGFINHPFDSSRVSGGSSSGSAAAVARKVIFGSLGTDTGGSLRVPSSFCGVVALKPTNGRISTRGVFPVSRALDTVGPIARSVADCATLFSVLADAQRRKVDKGSQSNINKLRLGFLDVNSLPSAPDSNVSEAYRWLKKQLGNSKLITKEVKSSLFGELNAMTGIVFLSEAGAVHANRLRSTEVQIGPQVAHRLLQGLSFPASIYLRALSVKKSLYAFFHNEIFSNADILLLPTTPCSAPLINDYDAMSTDDAIKFNGRFGAYTAAFNYLGLPALSMPMHRKGLPVGIQVVGDVGCDELVLKAAGIIEKHVL